MTLVDQLSIDYVNLTDTGFESAVTMTEFHAQPFGFLNGGATLAYCEAIAGMASNLMGKGAYVGVGQTITLLHGGKRSHVWEIKVTNEAGDHISQVTVVNALIEMKQGK